MVLYKSSLITLEYDPGTDILSLDWPDVQVLFVPAVKQDVEELVNNLKHYDVKKLLIDTSRSQVNVEDAQYLEFLVAFARQLMDTRLQKIARIGTSDPSREKLVNDTKQTVDTPGMFAFQVFDTREAAMDWLME